MGALDRDKEFLRQSLPLARAALQAAGDVLVARDGKAGDEKRLGAVDRIARRFPRPIHSRRWPQVAPALSMDAKQAGRSMEDELLVRVRSALLLVAPQVVDPRTLGEEGLSLAEVWEHFRKGLNRQITEDLLGGTEGRRAWESNIPLEGAPKQPAEPVQEADEEGAVLRLAVAAQFSERECELALALASGETLAEAARRLGIKLSTAYVMVHRMRKKITRARKKIAPL